MAIVVECVCVWGGGGTCFMDNVLLITWRSFANPACYLLYGQCIANYLEVICKSCLLSDYVCVYIATNKI